MRDEVTAARAEAASREQQLLEAHNEIARIRGELKGHTSEVKERTAAVGQARKEADEMRRSLTALQEDLARADGTIEQLRGELEAERLRNAETEDVTMKADRDRASQQARAEKLVRQLEDAAAENAELNRRLQDFEARRQLELADDQGRAQIDQLLQVTQERLAGQTEKLIARRGPGQGAGDGSDHGSQPPRGHRRRPADAPDVRRAPRDARAEKRPMPSRATNRTPSSRCRSRTGAGRRRS